MPSFHATTILTVRRDGQVAIGGDGQVTLESVVAKADAVKVRKLDGFGAENAGVLVGFAGSAADAFALLDRFEGKLNGACMKKILIVEDVELNLDLLVQLLEGDYELISAGDGAAGFEMALAEQPDLILMDMSLPVMNGWDATRQIKSNPASEHIPVLGLSAHAMESERERALAAGCQAYLTKPIDEDLLVTTIARALAGELS